jgi:hypothetical protein
MIRKALKPSLDVSDKSPGGDWTYRNRDLNGIKLRNKGFIMLAYRGR